MPSAPFNVTGQPGRSLVDVSWVKGASGGSALIRQTVTVYRNGVKLNTYTVTPGATTYRVKSLRSTSTYTFTVSATNTVGTSPESAMSAPVKPR